LHRKTTQEHYPFMGRITDLMTSGKVFEDLGVAQISSKICHDLWINGNAT
jgi:ferredoxin--NADP+ reductase